MGNTEMISCTAEFAQDIYKNMKMGADAVINLLPKTEDNQLRSHMTQLLDGYEKFASEAKKILDKESADTKEENVISKISAKMGIGMKTMVDSTPSHIAELLMEGAVMGICESTRLLHTLEKKDCSYEGTQLLRDIIAFEEHNLEKAKSFL